MAYFVVPPNSSNPIYDVNDADGPGSVWHMTMHLGDSPKEIALAYGDDLIVISNNPNVLMADIDNPIPEKRRVGNLRIFELKAGGTTGFTYIVAGKIDAVNSRQFNPWMKGGMQLEVKHATTPTTTRILLQSPHMAINATSMPVTYTMDKTVVITTTVEPGEIVDQVSIMGKLRHLAICCHGHPTKGPGGNYDDYWLEIGKSGFHSGTTSGYGPANTGLFKKLKDKVGVVWIGACDAAGPDYGIKLCKEIAKNANCYVAAPTIGMHMLPGQKPGPLARGFMDMDSNFKPVVFSASGERILWADFYAIYKTKVGFGPPPSSKR